VRRLAADSGPLIAFARGGLLNVQRQVSGEVLVPATVFAECCRDEAKPGASALIRARNQDLITIRPDGETPPGLRAIANLDPGETAALAQASIAACPVLMDDRLGRKVAASYGIPAIGGAGVLLAAKDRGLLDEIAPILAGWRDWGYFLSPTLLDAVLQRAGERP